MAVVSKTLSGGNQAPTLKLTITPKAYSVENNSTPVEYAFVIERPSTVNSTISKTYSINIGGQVFSGSTSIGGTGTKTIRSGTVTIKHNNDGTKTINFGFSMNVEITWSGTYNGTVAASANAELPTIPRATVPTLNKTTAELGETVTVTMQRASTSFTHNLKIAIGSTVIQIGQGYGISATYLLPLTLANYITNGVSYKAVIWCETYQGDTHIGSASVDLTLTIPSSIVPVVNTVTHSEANEDILIGEYVQGFSRLSVAVTRQGAYGSTVINTVNELDGVTYKGIAFETETLFFSGQKTLLTTITDSRGRTNTKQTTINVLEYYEPKITAFKAERCDQDGTLNESGQYVKITYGYQIAPLNNKNTVLVKFEYWNGTSYTTLNQITTGYTGESSFITTQTFDIDNSYDLRMVVDDLYSISNAYASVQTDTTTFDIHSSGKGMAFGKVAQEANLFDVLWPCKFRNGIELDADIVPTLLNDWQNYNTDLYKGASYYKDSFGVVHLAGMIAGGTTTAGTGVFVLEEGYRPTKTEIFLCLTASGSGSIRVDTNGTVVLRSGADATWTSLSGIAFKTI